MIHSTAIISAEAELAPDVHVGPFAVIEGPVTLGPGCMIHAHAVLRGPLLMGARNAVHPHVTLGDWPQDRKFKGEPTRTVIGDDNIFREGTTIHRATGHAAAGSAAAPPQTTVGSRCYFMVNAHVGHNCAVADEVTLVNGAALGGHVSVGTGAIIGAYSAIHQYVRVGRLAMISNGADMNADMPPFFISMVTNTVTQLNTIGLRRSGMSREAISALRHAFQLAFRQSSRSLGAALENLPAHLLEFAEVRELAAFVKASKRGVSRYQAWSARSTMPEQSPDQE